MAVLRSRTLLWLIVLVAVAAVAGLWMLRRHGLVSDRQPGRLETAIARRLVVLSIPADARKATNPLSGDAEAWRDGMEHFQEHCATCHGRVGRADSALAKKMYPPVPDLADPAIQQMSDGALFAIIQNGVSWTGMPAFRSEHTAEETWKLVAFIRRVPTLGPAELQPIPAHAAHEHESLAAPESVTMDGTTFNPGEMQVAVGDKVTWTNKDPFPHNVNSSKAHLHSPDIEPDATWSFTPTKAGRFEYECTLHPGMKGVLVVQGKVGQAK